MTPTRYATAAIALHWLVALLIAVTFPLGLVLGDMKLSPAKLELVSYHKWLGVTVVLLAVLRLLWRASHRPPPLPSDMPRWQVQAAALTHWGLYLLLLALPVSGWLYSSATGVPTVYLGLWQLPDLVARDRPLARALREVHELLAWTLAAGVGVHVAAAVQHQWLRKDGLLTRMSPWAPRIGSQR